MKSILYVFLVIVGFSIAKDEANHEVVKSGLVSIDDVPKEVMESRDKREAKRGGNKPKKRKKTEEPNGKPKRKKNSNGTKQRIKMKGNGKSKNSGSKRINRKSTSKKGRGRKRNIKVKTLKQATGEVKGPHTGPYGYMHPEEIDWTLAQYRCPECEDTLIIYDPWYGPPPDLHIPVVCSSNLSVFQDSPDLHNYGPNLTLIFIPGSLNCSNPAKAREINQKEFSIEVSQAAPEKKQEEPGTAAAVGCGKSAPADLEDVACGLEAPAFRADQTNNNCFWHFFSYEHWRRQVVFSEWNFPSCPDGNSTQGECCKSGPHMLISKTGYAKKLTAYCGPDPPKFDKSDFEKGKARWLVFFNNTGNDGGFSPKISIEAPTIGYRKSAAYDQLHYGERCICGLRKASPAQRPKVDPEISGKRSKKTRKNIKKSSSKTRKIKSKLNQIIKKNKSSKSRKIKNKKTKHNKNRNQKRIGVVKRDTRKKKRKNRGRKKNGKKTQSKKKSRQAAAGRQEAAAAVVDPAERGRQVWPWMASIIYDSSTVCPGYSVSPKIVVTTSRCFKSLFHVKGEDNSSVLELNQQLDLIKVIGQDELDVGRTDPEADWWEEERAVAQVLLHPNCDSATAPQFCVLVLVLTEGLSMQKPGRPRAACLNCMVDSYTSNLLKGLPFVAGYGLQGAAQPPKSGTYKLPKAIKQYYSQDCQDTNATNQLSSSESYCLQTVGNEYRCDEDKVQSRLGVRDYGTLLMNRVGRKGYKIMVQVVGLLWDFSCGQTGPARYIPTWPSLAWVMELVSKRDQSCVKLVRKSAWTKQEGKIGYYENKLT